MKRTLLILGMVVALVGFMTVGAQATLITGSIGFGGSYTVSGGTDFGTATTITVTNSVTLGTLTGAYASVPDFTVASFPNPIVFSPITVPIDPLWTFTFNGSTYSLQATSMIVERHDDEDITLQGNGIASITGWQNTPATWVFTASKSGSSLTFESTAAAVPEPATLLLLGVGMLGLGLVSRRRQNA